MTQHGRSLTGAVALAAVITIFAGDTARATAFQPLEARVIAVNIPGASAVAQVGVFLNDPAACSHPAPTNFPSLIQPGAVLDPNRVLVGSRSNFGAPGATGAGQEGSFLSVDPSGSAVLAVPADFASNDGQASTLDRHVQIFTVNSPSFRNGVNNPNANTAKFTAVSNPLGLSNNNAFGRIWPANAPFGDSRIGTSRSSIRPACHLPARLPRCSAASTLAG